MTRGKRVLKGVVTERVFSDLNKRRAAEGGGS